MKAEQIIAGACNQFFTLFMAAAAVSNLSQLQNRNNPALSTVSLDVKTEVRQPI